MVFQFSEADGLVVGQNKLALRTVFPVVNYRGHIEAILDPGCQIIAMSEKCAQELGLMYDPAITISMQSANGGGTPTKGMAHNVPFAFGNITLFLQVHIMETTVRPITYWLSIILRVDRLECLGSTQLPLNDPVRWEVTIY